MNLAILVLGAGFLVWAYVAYRLLKRNGESLTTMALVLIVMGIIGASLLGEVGVESPTAWAWLGTGLVMVAVQSYRGD